MSDDLKNAEFKITVVAGGDGLKFHGKTSLDDSMTGELFMTMLLAAASTAGAKSFELTRVIELFDHVSDLLKQIDRSGMGADCVSPIMTKIVKIAREACLSKIAEEEG